jgi:hypothetical protein
MFGFLVKKAFFDMWDNLFRMLLMNLGYILIFACFVLTWQFLAATVLFGPLAAVCVAIFCLYTGAVSRMCSEIADYRQPGFADFFRFLKENAPASLLLALVICVYAVVVAISFQYYGSIRNLGGWLARGVLFWITVACLIALQYYFPIQSRLDRKFRKIFRKMFLVFFDNQGLSIGLLLGAVLIFLFTFLTLLLLPGIATILLWWNVAFKLRLYKYDWLEANPGEKPSKVPWDALLVEDRERVGKRTFKGMIFPWKE